MKTENTISSPFDAWVQFINSSNWSDDRNYYQTIRNAFLEASRHSINQPQAFFVVANQLHQAGKTVVWPMLHNLWATSRREWKALRGGRVVKSPPPARPVIGHDAQMAVAAPAPKPSYGQPKHNGHHHWNPKPPEVTSLFQAT